MNEKIKPPSKLPMSDIEFQLLRELVKKYVGIHMTTDKLDTLRGRLGWRLEELGLSSYVQYYRRFDDKAFVREELTHFTNSVTTNLTGFYREGHHFVHLLDVLKKIATAGKSISILSAGCSTGMEPYTIAIEAICGLGAYSAKRISVLGIDVDSEVLKTARKGVYRADAVDDLPDNELRTGFRRGKNANAGLVQVRPEVMELVNFQQFNLVKEDIRSLGTFNIIFCRNVLIYFDAETSLKIVSGFEDILHPHGGLLYIGHSESFATLGIDGWRSVGPTVYKPMRNTKRLVK